MRSDWIGSNITQVGSLLEERQRIKEIKLMQIKRLQDDIRAGRLEGGSSLREVSDSIRQQIKDNFREDKELRANRKTAITQMIGVLSSTAMTTKTLYFRNQKYQNYASGAGQQQLINDDYEQQINDGLGLYGGASAFLGGLATGNPLLMYGGAVSVFNTSNRISTETKMVEDTIKKSNIQRESQSYITGDYLRR